MFFPKLKNKKLINEFQHLNTHFNSKFIDPKINHIKNQ